MANQVSARLKGDDYQHLFAWREALQLLLPSRRVAEVRVEDAFALSVDDVTVKHEQGCSEPDRYYQVKYHVDQRIAYSTDLVVERSVNGRSLLEKFYNTYKTIRLRGSNEVELYLISNWAWDSHDAIGQFIRGDDGKLKEDFFTASERSNAGKVHDKWLQHLRTDAESFNQFLRSLRIRTSYQCWSELKDGVAERMENRGLRHDDAALVLATGIVREWVKVGPSVIDRGSFEQELDRYDLLLEDGTPQAVTVVMNTIANPLIEVTPDFILDWCALFTGEEGRRGRQLLDPNGWNDRLLSEMRAVERRIKSETTARLVRARGAARLSPWFAFGHSFGDAAGYTIEFDQRNQRWRTDAAPSNTFDLVEVTNAAASLPGPKDTIAIAFGITDQFDADVRRYLDSALTASTMRVFVPHNGPSPVALKTEADAVALALRAKQIIRQCVRETQAARVLLFYCGPASGACFIGHRLNAIAADITVMEDQQPGYAPTFVLR